MKKSELKTALSAALSNAETPDPSEVLKRLIDASKEGDAALGAALMRHFSVVGMSLLALSWEMEGRLKRQPRGRPRANEFGDRDCWRAYRGWHVAKLYGNPQMSNLQAMERARELDRLCRIPKYEQAFLTGEASSCAQSLSRGRTKLGMSDTLPDRWKSAHCEAVFSRE
jgi:hypothetical protein